MSSGLAGSQQQTETTPAVHSFGAGVFPPLFMNNALSGQTPPPGLDVQQMVLASLDPSIANNPFQALYLSQLAAMSGQVSQASAEPSPSSSSAAVSSSSNGGAQSSLSPSADSANQMSITESQSAFNALSAGNLTGASTSDPSPTPGTTTSQSGEPAVPGGSAVADLPSWLTGLLPATQNANVSKPSQTVPTSTTPTTSSIPSFFEQMQLMTAAQTILGTSGVNPANAFASQPLNALAAALGQSAVAAQTTAASSVASLTANNTNAFLAASATNYSSPVKDAYCELCDKNFCNRYFLRTHRQKKHGILDDGSPVKNYSVASSVHNSVPSFPQGLATFGSLLPPPSTSLSAASNMQLPANLAALMAACSGNTVLPATSATVAASISQPTSVIVSSANSESPVNKVRKVSSPETEKTDNENDEDEKNKNLTMNGNSFSTTENTAFPAEKPSECDRCGKSFPSLFALLTHKACEHTPVHLSNSANPDMTSQRFVIITGFID
ncbi:hypothetical protein AB6A40_009348 [Gnathostoma spinigerum]|uniref:C2H2-type domain-containing protein n=1 Tax=Gnathostoma spinigerum TaxID=75299 RepID=A0ABD6EZD0_9BILA